MKSVTCSGREEVMQTVLTPHVLGVCSSLVMYGVV